MSGRLESSKAGQNALVVVLVRVLGPGGISWAGEAPHHTSCLILIVQTSFHPAQCSFPWGSWMEVKLCVLKS